MHVGTIPSVSNQSIHVGIFGTAPSLQLILPRQWCWEVAGCSSQRRLYHVQCCGQLLSTVCMTWYEKPQHWRTCLRGNVTALGLEPAVQSMVIIPTLITSFLFTFNLLLILWAPCPEDCRHALSSCQLESRSCKILKYFLSSFLSVVWMFFFLKQNWCSWWWKATLTEIWKLAVSTSYELCSWKIKSRRQHGKCDWNWQRRKLMMLFSSCVLWCLGNQMIVDQHCPNQKADDDWIKQVQFCLLLLFSTF